MLMVMSGGCGRPQPPSMWWAGGQKTHQAHQILAFWEAILPGETSIFDIRSAHVDGHMFF